MSKKTKIRKWAVALSLLIYLSFAFLIYYFDVSRIISPAIYLSNYSDIVTTIWQVQAAISVLPIAVMTLIVSHDDKTYLGLKLTDVLYISRQYFLSYWEKIVFSVMWLVLTWFSVIGDNIALISYMFLIASSCTISVIVQSITVISKQQYYKDSAKAFINDQIYIINGKRKEFIKTKKQHHYISSHSKAFPRHNTFSQLAFIKKISELKGKILELRKSKIIVDKTPSATQKFNVRQKNAIAIIEDVLNNLGRELSMRIDQGISISDDDSYRFLLSMVKDLNAQGQNKISSDTIYQVYELLDYAVKQKQYDIILQLMNCTYLYGYNRSTAGILKVLTACYQGDLSEAFFQKVLVEMYDNIKSNLEKYLLMAITLIRLFIYRQDTDHLQLTLQNVNNAKVPTSSKKKGHIFLITVFLLYYLSFQEPLYKRDKGLEVIETIKSYIDLTISKNYINNIPLEITLRKAICTPDMIFPAINDFYEAFSNEFAEWEYFSSNETKQLHILFDCEQFITFYSIVFFSAKYVPHITNLPNDVLTKIMCRIRDIEKVKDKNDSKFQEFSEWLKITLPATNLDLVKIISTTIKSNLLLEATDVRKNVKYRNERLENLKQSTIEKLKESKLYKSKKTRRNSTKTIEYEFRDILKNYSQHVALFGVESVVLSTFESIIFDKVSGYLDKLTVNFDDSYVEVLASKIIDANKVLRKEGIYTDTIYNDYIIDILESSSFPAEIARQLDQYLLGIRRGGQWDCRGNVSVFIDSTKSEFGFLINRKTFFQSIDTLSDEEISEEVAKYETPDGYIYSESVGSLAMQYEKDELANYLKVAMFKIKYKVDVIIPQEKIGFYLFSE